MATAYHIEPAAAAHTPWHLTPAAKAAIAAVVLADERETRHRKTYAQTTDEWYSYDGPLAAKVVEVWNRAFEVADEAYRAGDKDAIHRWAAEPRPDVVIDAAFEARDANPIVLMIRSSVASGHSISVGEVR